MINRLLFDPGLTLDEAQELIKNGADIHQVDQQGQNLLCYTKDIKIFKFLIEKGIDLDKADSYGRTILHKTDKFELIEILVKAGANVNKQDIYGSAPLYYYNKIKDDRITELLVNAGSNLNLLCDGQSLLSHWYHYQAVDNKSLRLNISWHLKAINLIDHGAIASERETYQKCRHLFTKEQQKVFDIFMTITSDDDFFKMCLAYQNDQKNNIKIDIKDMDIL